MTGLWKDVRFALATWSPSALRPANPTRPAGVTSAPMTFEHEGKQYIGVAFGDRTTKPELIAFVLGT